MVPRAPGSRGELTPSWLIVSLPPGQAPWLLQRFSWDTGFLHTAASLVNSSQTGSKGPQSSIWERSKLGLIPSCGTLSQSPCSGTLSQSPCSSLGSTSQDEEVWGPKHWLPVILRRLFTREPGCVVPPRNLQLQWSDHPHPGLVTRPGGATTTAANAKHSLGPRWGTEPMVVPGDSSTVSI